jgi:hypothetical protein
VLIASFADHGGKKITNPVGQYEAYDKSVSTGDFSFEAKHDGKYVYCFGNEHWGASSKEVSFNVHGIVYVSHTDVPADPLEAEVKKLSDMLNQVKDEQSYIIVRERTHRNTAESTNSRVKWWNLFVIGVVIGESVFQVWWLRRFFEVWFIIMPSKVTPSDPYTDANILYRSRELSSRATFRVPSCTKAYRRRRNGAKRPVSLVY